jgi:hypothetical protein
MRRSSCSYHPAIDCIASAGASLRVYACTVTNNFQSLANATQLPGLAQQVPVMPARINRLPNELLAMVFRRMDFKTRMTGAKAVCRRWAAIIDQLPVTVRIHVWGLLFYEQAPDTMGFPGAILPRCNGQAIVKIGVVPLSICAPRLHGTNRHCRSALSAL